MNKCSLLIFAFVIGAISAAPKDDKKPLAFPRKAFIYGYYDGKLESVGDGISATGDDVKNVNITLSGDDSGEFAVEEHPAEDGKIILKLADEKPLSDETLKKDVVIFTITATKEKESVTSEIFVLLPMSEVAFVNFPQNAYFGEYKVEDDKGAVTATDIKLDRASADVTIAVVGDYSEYFQASVDNDGKVTLNVIKDLADDVLVQNSEIIVTLIGSSGGLDDTTDVVLALPSTQPEALHFTKNVYKAQYSADNKLTVTDTIKVEGTDDISSVVVSIDDVTNFKLTVVEAGEITLELVPATLPDAVIKDKREVIVKVTATVGDDSQTSDVVVVLEKEVKIPLHFMRKVFVAEYEKTDKGEVTIKTDIDVEIAGNDDEIEIEAEKNIFNATVTGGKVALTWTDAKDALKDSKDNVAVKLTATDGAETDEATLYLVVLPKSGAFGHGGIATITLMMSILMAVFLA